MSLQTALQAVLAPLATGGAWNQRAAQGTVAPYIVWARVVSTTNNSLAGASNVQNTRVQIDAYAFDYLAVDAIATAIESAIAGSGISSIKLTEQDFFEDDTKLYRISQDFSLWST
jgi:hypothetical protein